MSTPRIVTPDEARKWYEAAREVDNGASEQLAYTISTEPERVRAAIVKLMREQAQMLISYVVMGMPNQATQADVGRWLMRCAEAIEQGEDY